MPIVVQHDPDIALVGAVSEQAGRGEFQKYKQEFEFRNQQFKQQIYNAQTQAMFQGIGAATSIMQPIMQMKSRERMQQAGFGHQKEMFGLQTEAQEDRDWRMFDQQGERDWIQQGYQLDRVEHGLRQGRVDTETRRLQDITNFKQNASIWSDAAIEMGYATTPAEATKWLQGLNPETRQKFFDSWIGLKSKHALNKQTHQPWHFDFRASNALQKMAAGQQFQSETMRKAFKGLSKSIADGDVSINDPMVQREAQRIMQTLMGGNQVGSQQQTEAEWMKSQVTDMGKVVGPGWEGVLGYSTVRNGVKQPAFFQRTDRAAAKPPDIFGQRVKVQGQYATARRSVAESINRKRQAENDRREIMDRSRAGDINKPPLVLLPDATEAEIDAAMSTQFPELYRAGKYMNLQQGPPSTGPKEFDTSVYGHPTYTTPKDASRDPAYQAGTLTKYFSDVMMIDKYPLKDPIATEAALLHGYPPIKGGYMAERGHQFEQKGDRPYVQPVIPEMAKAWDKAEKFDPTGGLDEGVKKYMDARRGTIIPQERGGEPVFDPYYNPEMMAPPAGSRQSDQSLPARTGMPKPITTRPPPTGINRPGSMPNDVQVILTSPDAPNDSTSRVLEPWISESPKYPGDTLTMSSQMFMQIRGMSKGDPASGLKPNPNFQFTVRDKTNNMFDFVERKVEKGETSGRSGAANLAEYSRLRVQITEEVARPEPRQEMIVDLNNRQKYLAATMLADQLLKNARHTGTNQVVWTHMPVAWSPSSDPEMKDAQLFYPRYNYSIPMSRIPQGVIYVRPIENQKLAKEKGVPAMLRVGMGITGLNSTIQNLDTGKRGVMQGGPMTSPEPELENPRQ